MTVYDYPINVTTFAGLVQHLNATTGNYLGLAIVLIIFFISFIVLKAYESKQAFLGCSYFAMVIAIIFRTLNILTDTVLYAFIIFCAISTLWVYFTRE